MSNNMLYNKSFADKLNTAYRVEYMNGKLFRKGRKMKWENANNVFNIEIVSFDGKEVQFSESGKTEIWTIDNIYIFDNEHVEQLFNSSKVYPFDIKNPAIEGFWNVNGIYIFHDERKGFEDKYYVGKSNNNDGINARLCDHSHESSKLNFDRILRKTNNFTVRCIGLENSGYSSTDALETAFIAYLKSYFNGYNRTKGNMGPASKKKSKNIILTEIL